MGTSTPLARGAHHALLTTPTQAAGLGWDLTCAPVLGIADVRKKLGDAIQQAAEGCPQVLRRHTTPIAVLVPATPAGVPVPAAEFTAADDSPAPAAAALATPAQAAYAAPTAAVQSGPRQSVAGPGPLLDRQQPTQSPAPATAAATIAVAAPAPPGQPAVPPAAAPATTTELPAPAAAVAPCIAITATTPPPGILIAVHPQVPEEPVAAEVRTSRRLAALAQALDDVLTPTTTAPGSPTAPSTSTGLSTGIRALDEALGGLQPGRFYLVAAAPGAGSSLIATAAARTTALDHHQPVLYAASGLTRHDVAARVTAGHLPVDYRRLRAGRLTTTEQQDVAALHDQLTAAPLYIDDGTDLTTAAIAESIPDIPGLALVVVDRLQTTADPRLPLSGRQRVTDAAQALAHLARTHELPVLAAIDTDDPQLLAVLAPDVTLTLTRDADQVHATITERDLGLQATLTLHADLAHARITDPYTSNRALTHEQLDNSQTDATTNPRRPVPQTPTSNTPRTPQTSAEPTPIAPPGPTAAPQTPAPESTAPQPAQSSDQSAPAAQDPFQSLTASAHAPIEPDPAAPDAAPRSAAVSPSQTAGSGGYAGRDYSYFTGMITRVVDQALEENGGDVEAATAALVKKAVPNAMALFEETRVGSNYDHTVYPEMPEFLRKKTRDGVDEIWEGRHNWTNTAFLDQLQAGTLPPATVDALDTNASFLSAFKTYLPIGALVRNPAGGHDSKRSGIYLLHQRPTWHHPHLPDPIGNRQEEGPVLLDEATVRLLIRCAGYKLCEVPVIAESWTSGASEGLLEKFRRVLTEAREAALRRETDGNADGTVTIEYIKAMYSKFTSTMGQSSANLEIRRPEWMHIVRSQAFANLWYKAYKAHQSGLTIVRVRGTDELHVTGGEWRKATGREGGVFEEGRLTTQMKLKNQYPFPRKTSR